MRKSLLAAFMLIATVGIGATTASAQFTSATACKAAQAWDASAAKCVSCKSASLDAKSLKSCTACKAGTAFDVSAAKCVKVTVKKG
jgi:hypothetical protein